MNFRNALKAMLFLHIHNVCKLAGITHDTSNMRKGQLVLKPLFHYMLQIHVYHNTNNCHAPCKQEVLDNNIGE